MIFCSILALVILYGIMLFNTERINQNFDKLEERIQRLEERIQRIEIHTQNNS